VRRFSAAVVIASLLWIPTITQTATAIYCYKGDPPSVYQACLAYNQGIGAQVSNQRQLSNIHHQIKNVQAQIDAIYGLIKTLNDQIAAQQKLVAQTQAVIQNLINSVSASSLSGTQKNGLLAKLNAALDALNKGQTNVACNKLSDFVNSVGTLISHGDISAAQGNAWINSANHVINTLGCTNNPCT